MDNNVDARIQTYRHATARLFETHPGNQARVEFTDPGPDASVLAEDFLAHLNLDLPEVHEILRHAYPYYTRVPRLRRDLEARLKFLAWMTLRRYNTLARAYRELEQHPKIAIRLGFQELPAYDTLRECYHDRLGEEHVPQLITALLKHEKLLLPELGQEQEEDATPLPARRRDEEAPYNGHYKTCMRKLEVRWDKRFDAVLAHAFYGGNEDEEPYANHLGAYLETLGIHAQKLYVDNAYTSFLTHAQQHRRGTLLIHRTQEDWNVCEPAAWADVEERVQRHWSHPAFPTQDSNDEKARFLYDHGSNADRQALGRWARDQMLTRILPLEARALSAHRSHNEAGNGTLKELPMWSARRGARCQYVRVLYCMLTVHMVQLTRLQNGVQAHLWRTTHIV